MVFIPDGIWDLGIFSQAPMSSMILISSFLACWTPCESRTWPLISSQYHHVAASSCNSGGRAIFSSHTGSSWPSMDSRFISRWSSINALRSLSASGRSLILSESSSSSARLFTPWDAWAETARLSLELWLSPPGWAGLFWPCLGSISGLLAWGSCSLTSDDLLDLVDDNGFSSSFLGSYHSSVTIVCFHGNGAFHSLPPPFGSIALELMIWLFDFFLVTLQTTSFHSGPSAKVVLKLVASSSSLAQTRQDSET